MKRKSSIIAVRVNPEMKARIELASQNLGKSVSSFIVDVAVKELDKTNDLSARDWLILMISEVCNGSQCGYASLGERLARKFFKNDQTYHIKDWSLSSEFWEWIDGNLQGVSQYIPDRRKTYFECGFHKAMKENIKELTVKIVGTSPLMLNAFRHSACSM